MLHANRPFMHPPSASLAPQELITAHPHTFSHAPTPHPTHPRTHAHQHARAHTHTHLLQVMRKYYVDPLRRDRAWSDRHAAHAALPSNVEALPLTMPCLDFVLVWHTNPARQPIISFWKPIAPPGYKPVSGLSTLGLGDWVGWVGGWQWMGGGERWMEALLEGVQCSQHLGTAGPVPHAPRCAVRTPPDRRLVPHATLAPPAGR